jgi:Flp pilus assembly protein TadD
MHDLGPPDIYCVSAAVGWLELGNATEARAELAQVSPANSEHPDVLEARWILAAEEKKWDEGLQVATRLIEKAPHRPSGWLHQAYALRRTAIGGLQLAWDALLLASEKFPKEATIAYNLSCYACQMHDLDNARAWLKRAVTIGDKSHIKDMALQDSDLEPLWPEIRDI